MYKGKPVKLKHLNNFKEIDNGKGANGQVFKCYHKLHDLEYAVKVWFPRDTEEEVSEDRFLSEIQKIKKLDHPLIVRIDYGDISTEEVERLYYCVMEYVEGTTLNEYLTVNIALEEKISIARQIIEAMEYSHKNEIYHGDLHSKNVMVTSDKVVKILDFGTSIFSGDSSKLRSSWLLSKTLFSLIPTEYISLLDDTIIDLAKLNKWHEVREKYRELDYPSPEIVIGSFKSLLEVVEAIRLLKTNHTKEHVLFDLASVLMRSPFIKLLDIVSKLGPYLTIKEAEFFLGSLVTVTNFSEEYHGIITEEIISLFNKNSTLDFENLSANNYYESHQKMLVDKDSYNIWINFYDKVLSTRSTSTLYS